MALENFNRIINLTFYRKVGMPVVIKCPIKGRKPSIEITGNFTTRSYLPAFNLTIKNLYLDLKGEQYTKLRVEAGYYGNTTTFEGSILTMYQEEPGPEGRTIIQCMTGQIQSWLDALVQMNYEKGTPLQTVLAEISKKINTYGLLTGKKAGSLSMPEAFEFNGTARDAIQKIEKIFCNNNLSIFVRDNRLCSVCLTQDDTVQVHTLQYMSAPPQENTGDENGTYYTTVTAPWVPKLAVGDKLRIPSRVYMRNFMSVGNAKGTQIIQVTAISFHFGTTGGTNSMTVQGFLVG